MAGFINKGTTATLVGYTLSVFLILYLTMTSQFLFPNPAYLPWFFYLLPHSSFIRFFYISISRCMDQGCLTKFSHILEGEMLVIFISMHLTAFVYFFVGLMINEPKWRKYVYRLLKLGSLRKLQIRIKQGQSELIDGEASGGLEL